MPHGKIDHTTIRVSFRASRTSNFPGPMEQLTMQSLGFLKRFQEDILNITIPNILLLHLIILKIIILNIVTRNILIVIIIIITIIIIISISINIINIILSYILLPVYMPNTVSGPLLAKFARWGRWWFPRRDTARVQCPPTEMKVAFSPTITGFSPNSVSTLRGSYEGRCLIRVLQLVCGILPVNSPPKWRLRNVRMHFRSRRPA